MAPINFRKQVKSLAAATSKHSNKSGTKLCKNVYEQALPLLEWLDYLRTSETTGTADLLLNGVQAAIIEVAGCLVLGFVRPAVFSIRAEVDMILAWLYFKDHPIEWHHIEHIGKGFKLKAELIDYLEEFFPHYKERYALLLQTKQRKEDEPYKLLSAHVHSQSAATVPTIGALDKLVSDENLCSECVLLQNEVTEYINDVLLSCFADKWASLPGSTVDKTKKRLSGPQLKNLFS